MSKNKKTEDIIREKLDGREFPFDEKAWAGMESMLDAQEKRRRFGFFWYFSASMFIALVAGAALYYGKESNLASQNSKILNSEVKDKKEETGSISQNSKEVTILQDNTNETTTKHQDNTVNPTTVEKQNNKETAAVKTMKQVNKQQTQATNTTKQQAKTTTTTNKQSSSDNTDKDLANNQNSGVKNVTEQKNTVNGSSATEVVTTNDIAINETQNIETGKQTIPENNIVAENNQVAVTKEEKAAEQLSVDTATAEGEKQNPLAAPGKETKNAWGVVAGVGAWDPLSEGGSKKGFIGFTGGLYYQRTLSKRFDLGISVLYSGRGALNFNKTYINSEFGFGVQSDKTIISPSTLHYLNLPLYFRFNISQRSHLIFGAAYYQLLATTYKTTHITENSFGVLESETRKETGDHPDFRKNDISAFLGYELTLFDRMQAGLQASYGFYDITKNDNYGANHDHNLSLQLLLKYDIIKH